jgi:virginiamycin B lyase
MQRLRPLILLLAALAALALTAAPALAKPRITELPLPAQFALPNTIASGPDGALWVTDSSLGRVWHITTKGKITSQDLGDQPSGIVSAGGALWIADASGDQIVRLGTDGTQTPYALEAGAFPTSLVQGPDGAIWFTETHGDKIGRLAADGTITEYPLATPGAFATDITVGPDGALWFSEESGNKVGRVTTDGVVTEFDLPYAEPLPGPIVVADGALYVALRNTNIVVKLDTDGQVIGELPLATENANPVDMVLGPDGALWISEHSANRIARMTLDGTVTREYKVPSGGPGSIAFGSDGALWIAEENVGQVARLDIGFDPPVEAHGTTFSAKVDRSVNPVVATFTDADPNARARDYSVTISWGDGQTSAGTVTRAGDGSFVVRGRHTYFRKGTRKVVVRITDGVGKGLDANVTSQAIVSA